MICKECNDIYAEYVCYKCRSKIIGLCRECHNELVQGIIKYESGQSVCGGNHTPYTEEDAQYFPGVCDKFRKTI